MPTLVSAYRVHRKWVHLHFPACKKQELRCVSDVLNNEQHVLTMRAGQKLRLQITGWRYTNICLLRTVRHGGLTVIHPHSALGRRGNQTKLTDVLHLMLTASWTLIVLSSICSYARNKVRTQSVPINPNTAYIGPTRQRTVWVYSWRTKVFKNLNLVHKFKIARVTTNLRQYFQLKSCVTTLYNVRAQIAYEKNKLYTNGKPVSKLHLNT